MTQKQNETFEASLFSISNLATLAQFSIAEDVRVPFFYALYGSGLIGGAVIPSGVPQTDFDALQPKAFCTGSEWKAMVYLCQLRKTREAFAGHSAKQVLIRRLSCNPNNVENSDELYWEVPSLLSSPLI
jgi:hypothetical protein